jgi:hypothetical protein
VFGIKPRGDVVGLYVDSNSNLHGFLLRKGTLAIIDVPGATLTAASGINPQGDIVESYDSSSGVMAFC